MEIPNSCTKSVGRGVEREQGLYESGGSPWATSNVMAKVCGITKTNTSVYREKRGDGYCARLETHVESESHGNCEYRSVGSRFCFLGSVPEPITNTSNPMSKLAVGIPFTKRPQAIISFDYKVKLSDETDRIRQTGFSRVTKVQGKDMPDVVCLLQKRWEDKKGNVYAQRIGTMIHRFNHNTDWVNGAKFPIKYGDITKQPGFQSYMGLISGDKTQYTRNSKGRWCLSRKWVGPMPVKRPRISCCSLIQVTEARTWVL